MKTNAIIRIVLFCLAILILSGILASALLFDTLSFKNEPMVETKSDNTVLKNTYSIDASLVRELEIEWVSGSIVLKSDSQTNEITIMESGDLSNEYPTVLNHDGDTFYIGFSEDSLKFPSFGISESISKNLIIQVPADWNCEKLSIDSASAHILVSDQVITNVEIDTASATATFENCDIQKLDIDTASGDVSYFGTLNTLDFDAVSASFYGTIYNCPTQLEVDSVSGMMGLFLPEDCGFTLLNQSLPGRFDSDFDLFTKNNTLVHGDGKCKIDISGLSKEVHINKHMYATETISCDEANCTDASHNHKTNHSSSTGHHTEKNHH